MATEWLKENALRVAGYRAWLARSALLTMAACSGPPPGAPSNAPAPGPAATASAATAKAAEPPSASAAPDPLRDAAARLAYVDEAAQVWLVGFDEAAQVVGKRQIATMDDRGGAYRVTWSCDGRYLGWREVASEDKHRLVLYDSRSNETWSVFPWRSYLFMGPANHGFVFYDDGPAYFEPRTETGARNEQAPTPRALRPPLPANDLNGVPIRPPNPLASWHDRVFLAVGVGHTSWYGGPQQLYVVSLKGDAVRVADDTPEQSDAISNLPMTALVTDTSGDFVAYFNGATAGREGANYDADYWLLTIRETHTWRVVGTQDAGCWERFDLSKGRCTATPSWLAPLGRGEFAFIKSKRGEAGPLLRARPRTGMTPMGIRASSAMGNDRGMLLWLAPAATGGSGSVLSVKRNGEAAVIAEHVVTALWAPPLWPDDSARRREVASRLAPADRDYGDPLRGMGWSNRCFLHIRAQRLEAARAACEMGLTLQPRAATAGALEYNLALIEERSGHRPEACDHLARSLAVRPDNKITATTAKQWECHP